MKPGDTVFLFHWGFLQKATVVGVFDKNVLVRLFSRNGEPSVIKIITPIKKVTPVGKAVADIYREYVDPSDKHFMRETAHPDGSILLEDLTVIARSKKHLRTF